MITDIGKLTHPGLEVSERECAGGHISLVTSTTADSRNCLKKSLCFTVVGNMVRSVDSMSIGLLSHFSAYEVIFLGQSDAMWNTMTVDKTFCKSMDGSFGRGITCRKGKSITRITIYFSKD